ncbi:glycosyltransferase family 9 protein [Mucilaginibacter sp. Bleaf8]|uniref:glycosyltransferase family 9 protein n=1 Tax=Mucilaginibacter sp. Bleaf8 TaxID=2834430 RepID=UPI001BCDA68C|nr:glycosyltransferase family 9 protein [Mucilaginibacter sp. Bleaf8]MBS7563544.1 glycosyltransferase family 9 protein [Mucilaginibacter sp. Bleaf8]
MSAGKHILVLRFSAMGDVAMTVPVIKELLQQHPDLHITYVSRPGFAAFFDGIDRLHFFPADFKTEYTGWTGSIKLFNRLKSHVRIDAVANLHNNLRSNILQSLYLLSGIHGQRVDKGRDEKKKLVRFPNKALKPLRSTIERYADVFRKLGFPVTLNNRIQPQPDKLPDNFIELTGEKSGKWIGIAPFAQHKGKIYPLGRMEEVVKLLNHESIRIFVFGGSPNEQAVAEDWEQKYQNVTSVINKINMQQELALISQLDVMLSMDSSGMHLASLKGIPVVSVWGATHHYAGFLGYGQSENNIIADDIACRPCSVYGNKPCFRKDYACLYNIEPQSILDKLLPFIL